jgi:hypothetical protein
MGGGRSFRLHRYVVVIDDKYTTFMEYTVSDEVKLLEAESLHCHPSKLTPQERARNVFGRVLTYRFDPYEVGAYAVHENELQLPDIIQCQSVVTEHVPSLVPVTFFKPELIPGTTFPIAGFPSLTILRGMEVVFDAYKLPTNIFPPIRKGSPSGICEHQCFRVCQ